MEPVQGIPVPHPERTEANEMPNFSAITKKLEVLVFFGGALMLVVSCAPKAVKPLPTAAQPTATAKATPAVPSPTPSFTPSPSFPTSTPTLTASPFPGTPTPEATATPSVKLYSFTARLVTPTPVGSLSVKGDVSYMAWVGNTLYWAGAHPGDGIYKYDVATGKKELFLRTDFATGALGSYQFTPRGDKMVFLDVDYHTKVFQWKIERVDLRSREKETIWGVRDNISWPGPYYDFDGRRVAIAYDTLDRKKHCTVSHLMVVDISTGARELVDEHCADYGPFLWGPVALHNDVLVAEQDLPDKKGKGSNMVIFRHGKDGWKVSERFDDERDSMPVMNWPWLVWKKTKRYVPGYQNMAYNLETHEKKFILTPNVSMPTDPELCGDWIVWSFVVPSSSQQGIGGEAYFYKLPNGPFIEIERKAGSFEAFACSDRWVAWAIMVGRERYRMEWIRAKDLPVR